MPDLPDHQRRIAVTGLVASGAIAGLGARTFGSQESPMSTTVHASGLADWHAYLLADDGLTWKLDTEFHLRRTA